MQFDVGGATDSAAGGSARAEGKFEIWARIKFEGPGFEHGKSGERDSISVERVVLVRMAASG